MSEMVMITLIIMGGILLSIIAWQLLSIGKTAAGKAIRQEVKSESRIIKELEELQQLFEALQDEVQEIKNRRPHP